MCIPLAADVAWWGIVLVLVGLLALITGTLLVVLGGVDILRPRIQSTIAARAGIDPKRLDATSPEEYKHRGKRRAVRGAIVWAVGAAILVTNVLLDPID